MQHSKYERWHDAIISRAKMPTRPPLHRVNSPRAKRHTLRQSDPERTERLRGRKAVVLRQRRLMAEPLCRHCYAKGRIAAATVPDHIIPLHKGGSDEDSNIQCLCGPCHKAKTSQEIREIRASGGVNTDAMLDT